MFDYINKKIIHTQKLLQKCGSNYKCAKNECNKLHKVHLCKYDDKCTKTDCKYAHTDFIKNSLSDKTEDYLFILNKFEDILLNIVPNNIHNVAILTYFGMTCRGNLDIKNENEKFTYLTMQKSLLRYSINIELNFAGKICFVVRVFHENPNKQCRVPLKKIYSYFLTPTEIIKLTKEENIKCQCTDFETGETLEQEQDVEYM